MKCESWNCTFLLGKRWRMRAWWDVEYWSNWNGEPSCWEIWCDIKPVSTPDGQISIAGVVSFMMCHLPETVTSQGFFRDPLLNKNLCNNPGSDSNWEGEHAQGESPFTWMLPFALAQEEAAEITVTPRKRRTESSSNCQDFEPRWLYVGITMVI